MDSLAAAPVRPPRSRGRFIRRVRVGLTLLLLVGWVSMLVLLALDPPSFFGQEPIIGKVVIAFGGLHLLLAGVWLPGRWRSGRQLEWLVRTLIWLQILLVGLGMVLVGEALVFHWAPRMYLPGVGLLGGAILLSFIATFIAQQVVLVRTRRRQAALRTSR